MSDSIAVWQPGTVEEALDLKENYRAKAMFIAGGTLLQMQREQGIAFPPHLISLERIHELSIIKLLPGGSLSVGALATLNDCRQHALLKHQYPALFKALGTVAAPAVRNKGTIGGNVLYGIGDTIPLLLVLGAFLRWRFQEADYTEPLEDYTNRKTPPHESAVLSAIILPPESAHSFVFFEKTGRREAFVPSVVTVAVRIAIQNQIVQTVRLAVSGGISRPHRLRACEQVLKGKKLSEELLAALPGQIEQEAQLTADAFASADYRKQVAANIITAYLAEL